MADAFRGKDVYLKAGPAANNLTEISGEGNGLQVVNLTRTPNIRQIPGGGTDIRRQSMDMLDNQFPFTVDKNPVTEPLFEGKEGQRIYFEYGASGNATGKTKQTFSGFATIDSPAPFDGAVQYSINIMIDGGVTKGTY